ncbi:ATP-dependent DNA helicase Q4 [Anopheles marshallii]|uniref:ATP-dependent DNA helicase Q4 n=1 Tax=Anopheles marshallii TaxID=1521116 RepID=UPI00237A8287|nr:ATP-dependent DNA helicase Q4 [Anopheles marshallii]
MEDQVFRAKYQKCKYRVKQWEKEFKKKYGRIPSKLDIRDSPSEIKNSYKMYYQLKTTLLKNTLLEALDDDDDFDGSLMSQESSFSQEPSDVTVTLLSGTILNDSAMSEGNSSMTSLLTKPIASTRSDSNFEAEKIEQHNLIAWQGEKSRKSVQMASKAQKEDVVQTAKPVALKGIQLMPQSSLLIPKRNPRKSVSRNSLGLSSQSSLTGFNGNESKIVLPDLETLLMAKSKELECNVAKVEEKLSAPPLVPTASEPINQLDERWLNRQSGASAESGAPVISTNSDRTANTTNFGLRNINLASLSSATSFGMSSLSVTEKSGVEASPKSLPVEAGVQNTAYDAVMQSDSDGVIENSEDESTKTSPGMLHIAKKRKIFTAINRSTEEARVEKETQPSGDPEHLVVKQKKDLENLDPKAVEIEQNETTKQVTKKRGVNKKVSKPKSKQIAKRRQEKAKSVVVPRARPKRSNARKVATYTDATLEGMEAEPEQGFSSDDADKDPDYKEQKDEKDHEELESDQEDEPKKRSPPKQVKLPKKQTNRVRRTVKNSKVISPKLSPGSSKPVARGRKPKLVTQRKIDVDEDDAPVDEPQEYVPEFGLDRLKSIPRVDINELVRDAKIANSFIVGATGGSAIAGTSGRTDASSTSGNDKALRKKLAAGKQNENFVRIDLRKKKFVKGKKTINFSRYKKSQWKAKKIAALSGPDMDMRGCDGGVLMCFQCGGSGHMAFQCKKPIEDKLLPYDEDTIEDSAFPTLEEAEAMVKSQTVVVHSNRIDSLPPAANPTWKEDEEERMTKSLHKEDGKEDPIDPEGLEDEFEEEKSIKQLENEPSKLAYIGHKIPEDFLKQSKLLEATVSGGFKGVIEPLYVQQTDGELPSTPSEVFDALHMFGHKNFRHGQERAVMRVLCGMSTLVTLSTGAGKSLCYQLPAYLYRRKRNCITLVISPLVSLMEDQVHGMPDFLNAHCLHTNQTPKVRDQTMQAINAGEVDILLISPEAVVSGEKSTGFGSLLRQLPPIAFACIDEAHCVSQWSHNFRPSYLMICKVLKEKLGVKTILGLTATATVQTRQSIVSHLAIPDGLRGIISDIPLPDNLLLTVSRDVNRDVALVELLQSDRFSSLQSIIVYCTRRDDCERVASFVRTCFQDAARAAAEANAHKRKRLNYVAEPYHAGMAASRRRTIQNAFMSGELRIVVATIAFGMGINKADIRAIIHYNMPKNFESYVQEVGRAGRDGLLSHCHLFLDNKGNDRNELRRFIYANSIDRHVIRKLLQKIFVPCACAKILKNKDLAQDLHEELRAVNGIDWDACFEEIPPTDGIMQTVPRKRLCPGHEICFPIESTVQQLDIPEENIATFLCYLELDDQRYIKALSPAYTMCKVMSYGGARPLRHAAKECAPLAMAFALDLKRGISHATSTVIEFPVIDVASAIGWDSGVVKHQLKNLEWTTVNNVRKRSPLSVVFFDLGFRIRAPGDLTDEELDQALDGLYERVTRQERTQLAQLQYISDALNSVCFNTIGPISRVDCPSGPSEKLKTIVRRYFTTDISKENIEIIPEPDDTTDEQLIADIRTTICRYPENNFTGRAIARLFHGVQSPNYSALVWSRSNFWRSYTKTDFNRIVRLANAEIVRMRT